MQDTQILNTPIESDPQKLQVQIATFTKEAAYQTAVLNGQIATLITVTRELSRQQSGRAGSGD